MNKLTKLKEGLEISWLDKNGENIGKIVKLKLKTFDLIKPDNTKKQLPYIKIDKIIKKGGTNKINYENIVKKYDFERTDDYKKISVNIVNLINEKKIWNFNGDLSYKNLAIGDIVNVYKKNKGNKWDYNFTGIINGIDSKYLIIENSDKKLVKISIPYRIPEFNNIIKVFKNKYYISYKKNKKIVDAVITSF